MKNIFILEDNIQKFYECEELIIIKMQNLQKYRNFTKIKSLSKEYIVY